jgi:FkbM family methyltransferase
MSENFLNVDTVEALLTLPTEHASQFIQNLRKSKSQLGQDFFVLSTLDFKSSGYFVEFGATNGVDLSNTYLLEKEFGWSGILAEPARCWHADLAKNRSSNIEHKCVWKDSTSTLTFNEANLPELSTVNKYINGDLHGESRLNAKTYAVETISLNDLLESFKAPTIIDYLSIDTEGSEFEILSSIDYGKYTFRVITCEHNYTPMREKIHSLLTSKGYVRKYQEISKCDDWYIHPVC